MVFDTFAEAWQTMLWSAFAIAFVMGALVNKTNFCTMGAVSDWVNMGDTGRIRSWLFAIAIAMIGVVVLESQGLVNAGEVFPPYRGTQLIWAENLLGGVMFGIGMTLASGCGNKTLVRIGGGNLKSILVFAIIAVIAYFMTHPFPGTDQTLMSVLFYDWIRPLSISLSTPQDLGSLIGGTENAMTTRLWIGLILGAALIVFVFMATDFRGRFDNILGGLVIGLGVLGAWYVTSVVTVSVDGEQYSLQSYMQEWDFLADSTAGKPAESRPLAPQSYTFINPMGQMLGYATAHFKSSFVTFGVMAVLGVVLGSLAWSLVTRNFRLEWFVSWKDFFNHAIGAVLMGFGGVLGLGCTIGQGVTGVSTLAVGSFITFGAIVLGSALTMKIQYYKLLYENDATFGKALITALVDFRLLPGSMRKLEAL